MREGGITSRDHTGITTVLYSSPLTTTLLTTTLTTTTLTTLLLNTSHGLGSSLLRTTFKNTRAICSCNHPIHVSHHTIHVITHLTG